ncbi:MAG: DUF4974 domain-containing protein [Bacteroidetes bacterium]|nr:DUF4974 domain-containing protein [Bacteroidota bacterium]MBU1371113.1 DUF4974 domain-containing protein [Bacteroidota bacterium]MBU1486006.1 DUF4974 domain-containing protein [Bacteroidota bacterium]MBU1759711.1 DUF4974 domain-containing protein [Bacteroidota bacterium]MBU2047006.1 DUF4974 domain-containing protein [Bacteroidota bacterium]
MRDEKIVNSFLVADLIAGYLKSTLNEEQKEALSKWIKESDAHHKIFMELIDEQKVQDSLKQYTFYDAEKALLKFKSERESIKLTPRPIVLWYKIALVASIICILSFGIWSYLSQRHPKQIVTKSQIDVVPGGNKAILTLANGKKIILDSSSNGEIAKEGGVIITKTKGGRVIYDLSHQNNFNEVVAYNTISTPRGGQYQVILPDGSQAWLNAASSIHFPTVFKSNERKVEITGEVYFEVSKDKTKPFRVMTGDQMVEVLGTHFNVMAYADEKATVTTLLEGSVKVSNSKNQVLLKPNQEATLHRDNQNFAVKDADAESAVMWKNGYFLFNDESLESIMRKISRWYNVEVVYKGDVAQKTFGGTISRFKNLSELLEVLQATGSVHFKIEEGRIIAMP